MVRHGRKPYLECSTRGDRRFSAFCAMVDGKSIEEQYQAAKVFADGSTGLDWRSAKGRRAVNQRECAALYARLWDRYMAAHPELCLALHTYSGVSDGFGQPRHCCSATELWRIRQLLVKASPWRKNHKKLLGGNAK